MFIREWYLNYPFLLFYSFLAMEASRLQLETCQTNQGSKPVLEEFIPLKQPSSEGQDKASNMSEKSSWMTTAQLWSQTNDGTKHQPAATATVKETDTSFGVSPKLTLDNKQRNGGAFHPFSRERNICTTPPIQALPELALASLDTEMEEKKCLEPENLVPCPRRESCSKGGAGATVEQGKGAASTTEGQTMSTTTTQTHRKARRCWSPDLHHRFVNALQMLGGSQGNKNMRNLSFLSCHLWYFKLGNILCRIIYSMLHLFFMVKLHVCHVHFVS